MGFVFLMSYANSAHRWLHVLTFNGMDYAFGKLAMGLEKLERGSAKFWLEGWSSPRTSLPHVMRSTTLAHWAKL